MSARITEHRLGEVPWLVVNGERGEAFRLLGERAADRIRAVAGESATIRELRARAEAPRAAGHLATVRERSRAAYPEHWAELAALAEGSGVPLDDLVLLNLRGDLGAEDGTGCTDVAFSDEHADVVAHNEDGAPELVDQGVVLTLALDGEPSVTVWWLPGFLPANTFVVTEHGLVWGIDHIGVVTPAAAPGRHFVARSMQRCRTVAEVTDHLGAHPSAGGFAYTVGQVGRRDTRQIEAAAGHCAHVAAGPGHPGILWHTNHLRRLTRVPDAPRPDSLARAEVAATWTVPEEEPVDWCLRVLAETPAPLGVRRDAAGEDPLVTLATMVVDLRSGMATVAPRARQAATLPVEDLARGIPDRQRRRTMTGPATTDPATGTTDGGAE
ncbi:C45 family autoproteolytic acyltransferase/hydolase [Streptomyces sp. SBT349]|uniref:C45 family autoproteolytic acyltransferase/hydolase n=1 Tax=Streptomyces sp. SBT349 TaxID=1580539 RepID=UPI00066C22D3|nr:C45 family peptidase [Streptomyces sp. SBT349]